MIQIDISISQPSVRPQSVKFQSLTRRLMCQGHGFLAYAELMTYALRGLRDKVIQTAEKSWKDPLLRWAVLLFFRGQYKNVCKFLKNFGEVSMGVTY